jgi:hypothetical protein
VYLNAYSIRIPGAHEDASGYVELRHGQQYVLVLHNGRQTRCDAHVEIDGKHVGTFRLGARTTLTLERPAHDNGRFTFYRLGSPEARAVQLSANDPNLGLVRVVFTPELIAPATYVYNVWTYPNTYQPSPYTYATAGNPDAPIQTLTSGVSEVPVTYRTTRGITSGALRSAGGTGLSGHSAQHFHDAEVLTLDYSQQTTIHLRLVEVNHEGPRPLTAYSTPVPPRVA